MLLVKGDKITFKYESQTQDLLLEISFRIDNRSRIGVLGKNGSGKSTLLKIILGDLLPSSGHLQKAADLKIGYLEQVQSKDEALTANDYIWQVNPHLYSLKRALSALENDPSNQNWSLYESYEAKGGYALENLIERALSKLRLKKSLLDRPLNTLSGGEKTRIGLLRVLMTEPDVLVLDEPTNNLDILAIEWLKSFLHSANLPYVVVSHDRSLLNEVIDEIWELEAGCLTVFPGNFNSLQKMKAQRHQSSLEQYRNLQRKIGQLRTAALKRRVDANRMENFKQSRSIKKNGGLCKRDEGSGSASANPKKKMGSAKALEMRVQLLMERDEAKKPWADKARQISLPVASACSSKKILSVDNLGLTLNRRTIFSDIEFSLLNGQRLAIIGPNGSGKTSLIKILSGQLNPSRGNITWSRSATLGVFYQDSIDLSGNKTVLDSVWQPEVAEEHVARTILGSLGFDANLVHQKVGSLSPGERVKTSLAKVILSGANVLILDEPTNHLELQAREMLERALDNYEGTVIFVSHDTTFIQAVGTHAYDLSNNQMSFL